MTTENEIFDVYKIDSGYQVPDTSDVNGLYQVVIWRPSITNLIPEGFPSKYIAHWFLHYLGIFKNKNYRAMLVYDKGKLISKMIVTPAYYKFPFMEPNDLQFTYSVTDTAYRGKGINTKVKFLVMRSFQEEKVSFWGVVDPGNKSSIIVLKKLGMTFRFQVKGKKLKGLPYYYCLTQTEQESNK